MTNKRKEYIFVFCRPLSEAVRDTDRLISDIFPAVESVRENIMATREGSPANSLEDFDSDSEYEQGSETSDSDEISSEESSNSSESEENSDDELNNTPERAALWTCVYPPEDDPVGIDFVVRDPGVRNMPSPESSPLIYLSLFLTQEILNKIVAETRRYAEQQMRGERDQRRRKRDSCWDTCNFGVPALKKYLGLTLLMGLVKKKDTTMYWNTKFSCLSTPYFGTIMSRNNFQLISKYLHCFDNTRPEAKRDNALYDPLHKFRLVLDALNCSCKKHYIPKQLISIDESLIGLKNRTELIQYIPNKHHHKWGVKLYAVTESSSGYPLHTMVYCGKKRSQPASQFGHFYDVVRELMLEASLFHKGYHLYVDNFYTSPTLAEFLYTQRTLLTGTLRANRKGVPVMMKSAKPKVGECFYARKGPLLALSWKEKKSQKNPCLMLTTGSGAQMINHTRRNGQIKELPKTVSLYNQNMGGVDLLDQMVDHVAGERPFHKFWKKCFFSIIDRMAFSSYILYEQNTSARRKLTRFRFMCTLVEELCATPEDQPVAIPIPVRQASLVHRAVLLLEKKRRTVLFALTAQPLGEEREVVLSVKVVALGYT